MDVGNIGVEKYYVSQLFNQDESFVYEVPKYQREYKWRVREWEALYDDLTENGEGYFLGSVICINKSRTIDTRYEVVDGQQRMTTISIFLAAIYTALQVYKDRLDEEQQQDMILLKRRLVAKKSKDAIRLIPQAQKHNLDDYMGLLTKLGIAQGKKAPQNAGNRRIFKAYNYFKKRLEKSCAQAPDPVAKIFEIYNLLTKAIVVAIYVPSHSDAYKLFESLNNRGTPLTAIDLVKNLLLACVDEKGGNVDDYFDKWNDILDFIGEEDMVQERFFRQNYNAFRRSLNAPIPRDNRELRLGPIATRSTMLDIYERLVKRDPFWFVEELRTSAEAYGKILLTNTDGLSARIKRSFMDLQRVQGAPSYMLMLYLLKRGQYLEMDDSIIVSVSELLVKFFVRRNLTNTPPTMDLTRIFMSFVDEVEDTNLKGRQLYEKLRERLIVSSSNDEVFEASLRGPLYEDNPDLVRFMLCMLAQDGMTKESIDLWKKTDSGQYIWTIEHIFPQGKNIPQCWVDMIAEGDLAKAQEYRSDYVHMLGNLTITGYNTKLSNFSFESKRDRKDQKGCYIGYRNGINLNADVCDKTEWTVKEIVSRTEKLAKRIVEKFNIKG